MIVFLFSCSTGWTESRGSQRTNRLTASLWQPGLRGRFAKPPRSQDMKRAASHPPARVGFAFCRICTKIWPVIDLKSCFWELDTYSACLWLLLGKWAPMHLFSRKSIHANPLFSALSSAESHEKGILAYIVYKRALCFWTIWMPFSNDVKYSNSVFRL